MKVHLCSASVQAHHFSHVLYVLGLCAFFFSCTSCFSGLGEKNNLIFLTHKIYFLTSHFLTSQWYFPFWSNTYQWPKLHIISLKETIQEIRLKDDRWSKSAFYPFSAFHHPALPTPGKVSASIDSNIEIVHISPPAAPLPSLDPWEKAAAEQGKSKQITLKYCFMGDLGESTIILNLIPCMTHATIPNISGSAHIPGLLGAHCSPSQAWFKGSQVMRSLPHHLTVWFPQIAPFKVENSLKKMKLAALSSSWRFQFVPAANHTGMENCRSKAGKQEWGSRRSTWGKGLAWSIISYREPVPDPK